MSIYVIIYDPKNITRRRKNCKNMMVLTENAGNLLYYNCTENHNEHAFRYNVEQKKWEKIIVKTKLALHYNNNPIEESVENFSKTENKSNRTPDRNGANPQILNLKEINGIGSKRAQELESAGIRTVADLAKRSPKHLAEKTGLPISQISTWIIEANNLTKSLDKIPA